MIETFAYKIRYNRLTISVWLYSSDSGEIVVGLSPIEVVSHRNFQLLKTNLAPLQPKNQFSPISSEISCNSHISGLNCPFDTKLTGYRASTWRYSPEFFQNFWNLYKRKTGEGERGEAPKVGIRWGCIDEKITIDTLYR